jgi:hypothetical protein
MPSAPPPVSIEIGDIVGLIGKPPRFIIREILPDGKHAVCERAVFVGSGPSLPSRAPPIQATSWPSRTWRSLEHRVRRHRRVGSGLDAHDDVLVSWAAYSSPMSQCAGRPAGAGAAPVNECKGAAQKRRRSPVVGPVREKGPICLSSRAASYTADKANRNPSGRYTRDANRGNNDTESAGR